MFNETKLDFSLGKETKEKAAEIVVPIQSNLVIKEYFAVLSRKEEAVKAPISPLTINMAPNKALSLLVK